MIQILETLLTTDVWWSDLLRILLAFAIAWLILRLAHRISRHLVRSARRNTKSGRAIRSERVDTMQRLVFSFLTFVVYAMAVLVSLNTFLPAENLVWLATLFAAAFGLGLMPLVRDFFTGVTYLFEDPFDVGEKIELHVPHKVQGVVEHVNLRTTMLRAPTGELYTIPNGEIRVIRNFSRGRFSTAQIFLTINTSDLVNALDILHQLGEEAMLLLPNLLEPWQIITPDGHISLQIKIEIIAKSRFGKAVEMHSRLLSLVNQRLQEAGITLVD
jgi:small conductance mechanosensitive channel